MGFDASIPQISLTIYLPSATMRVNSQEGIGWGRHEQLAR